jgi:hypothetical protein
MVMPILIMETLGTDLTSKEAMQDVSAYVLL